MLFKTFNVPSFFAGVATVLAILVVGFGGGVMMSGVLSDSSHQPNKIERQAARDSRPETKPVNAPMIAAAPVVAAVPANPAPAAAERQPSTQQPAEPQPETQPPPVAQPQTAAQPTPSPGPEKQVSLTQPPREPRFDPSQLSRREQARYWRDQRREERAQRREERRKLVAERRQQEQTRREEMRSAVERARPRDADDDRDDDAPSGGAPRERIFGAPPPLRLFGGDD